MHGGVDQVGGEGGVGIHEALRVNTGLVGHAAAGVSIGAGTQAICQTVDRNQLGGNRATALTKVVKLTLWWTK